MDARKTHCKQRLQPTFAYFGVQQPLEHSQLVQDLEVAIQQVEVAGITKLLCVGAACLGTEMHNPEHSFLLEAVSEAVLGASKNRFDLNSDMAICRPPDIREGASAHGLKESTDPGDGLDCHPPKSAGRGSCSPPAGNNSQSRAHTEA